MLPRKQEAYANRRRLRDIDDMLGPINRRTSPTNPPLRVSLLRAYTLWRLNLEWEMEC